MAGGPGPPTVTEPVPGAVRIHGNTLRGRIVILKFRSDRLT